MKTKWNKYPNKKPNIGQEVLIFRQGYDITGKVYWSSYNLAVYLVNIYDKHKRCFAEPNTVEREKDGTIWKIGWGHDDVTHWMPLPENPEKVVNRKRIFLVRR